MGKKITGGYPGGDGGGWGKGSTETGGGRKGNENLGLSCITGGGEKGRGSWEKERKAGTGKPEGI